MEPEVRSKVGTAVVNVNAAEQKRNGELRKVRNQQLGWGGNVQGWSWVKTGMGE